MSSKNSNPKPSTEPLLETLYFCHSIDETVAAWSLSMTVSVLLASNVGPLTEFFGTKICAMGTRVYMAPVNGVISCVWLTRTYDMISVRIVSAAPSIVFTSDIIFWLFPGTLGTAIMFAVVCHCSFILHSNYRRRG